MKAMEICYDTNIAFICLWNIQVSGSPSVTGQPVILMQTRIRLNLMQTGIHLRSVRTIYKLHAPSCCCAARP